MRWLDRLTRRLLPSEPPQLHDPDLGHVAYDSNGWSTYGEHATTFRDDLQPVSVTVPGTEEGPSDAGRRAYDELQRRYDDVSGGIAGLLFDQFQASFGSFPDEDAPLPAMSKPEDILKHAGLTHIFITLAIDGTAPSFQLMYGFDWDPDHCYCVTIKQWKATDLAVDG